MRKVLSSYTKAPVFGAAMGDSHTLNYAYNVRQFDFYPDALSSLLTTGAGRSLRLRNWGISGDTTIVSAAGGSWTATVGMRNRFAVMTAREVPKIAVIYASTNDFSCIAAGGSFPSAPGATTATVSSVVTRPNVEWMVDQLVASGCTMIVLGGYHVRNWAAGGDVSAGVIRTEPSLSSDPGAVFGDSSRWANYQAYLSRVALYPGKVAWCDFYAFFKSRLEGSYPAQIGVDSFLHVGTSNTHLNTTGESWLADALYSTIQAQSGWVAALSAA